ncbi:MAG: GHKL domain-containing protein [Acidobacteria bacterium]|nr:GHKL domain-containing protein [Acidobacteriota bacterium]
MEGAIFAAMAKAPRRRSRRFWTWATLFSLFVVADIGLFGWLIFRSLSQRELDRVLLETREEAQTLAGQIERGAERAGGDLVTAVYLEQETQTYIDSVLRQRQIVQTVEITDRDGALVAKRRSEAEVNLPAPDTPIDKEAVPDAPKIETKTIEHQQTSQQPLPPELLGSLEVTVPIGELGSLRLGLSPVELERRIGVLREDLVRQTTLIGGLTLVIVAAAVFLISALVRRGERLEAQAAEAERLAYLGTLAAGLAHEIRNPLNSLSLNMQMLEEEIAEPRQRSAQQRLLAITRSELGRLERLVTDFLSYARPRPLRREVLPARELLEAVREVLAAQAAASGFALELRDEGQGVAVQVDPELMRQLLLNLVQNAIAATEGSGRKPRIELGVRRRGPVVELSVADNGVGIPSEELEKVFDLFYSTRKGGTGLGLAIVERIATAHGGTVSLESEPGRGTTFRIELPVAAAPRPA